jgi:hypothetical protein
MIIDFSQVLKDRKDQELTHKVPEEKKTTDGQVSYVDKPLTLCDVCVTAIDFIQRGEEVEPAEKYRRGKLAERIYKLTYLSKESVNLTVEDITFIKGQVGKLYGPFMVTTIWDLLDPIL